MVEAGRAKGPACVIMTMRQPALSDANLHKIMKGARAYERAVEATTLFMAMDRAVLTPDQRVHAHEIVRIMAGDASRAVRYALAITLRSSPLVPHDVALRLSHDTDEIALTVIKASDAFTDEDLVEIVRTAGEARQVAIATRPRLSERVTGVIADMGLPKAVRAACANDNAAFSERAFSKVIDRFPMSEEILMAMAYRQVLPLAISEKLVSLVGDQVRDHLVRHHGVPAGLASDIATGSTERVVVDLIDEVENVVNFKEFTAHLHAKDKLSASLLLRALAHGHMAFFEWGVAELAGVPHQRTWMMIHDSGPLGFKAIYERAGLPSRLFLAFRAGVDTYQKMDFDGHAEDLERFQERMLQRFLTQNPQMGSDDLDYLIDKLGRLRRDGPQATVSDSRLLAANP